MKGGKLKKQEMWSITYQTTAAAMELSCLEVTPVNRK
jgi:hypothetical protein